MDGQIGNLFKKYGSNNNSKLNNSFVNLAGGYDVSEIDNDIREFNAELKKQNITNDTFNDDNEIVLDKCKKFIENYADSISKQSEELARLSKELPNIIKNNKAKAEVNEDLKELIASSEYVDISNKLRDMKTNIQKLKLFLVEEGIHNF